MYKLTPQQQAEKLFDSMKCFRVKHSFSRKCAKVACDYLINDTINTDSVSYWQQVKTELDKCGKQ